MRSSSLSPMPTRIPLVNGIRSSPAARIVSSRRSGCLVGEPWWATRSGLTDSSISPCEAVTSRSRARSSRDSTPRFVWGSRPRSSARSQAHDDVGREVLEARLGQALAHARVVVGRLAGEHQQLLDAAAGGAVEQPLDLVGLVQVRLVRRERAVLAVALARPRQRERDVAREGDAAPHPATLQTRLRRPRAACCAADARARLLLALAVAAALVVAGCAHGSEDRPDEAAQARLDFTPNAVHAGIYLALERGSTAPRAST